MPANLPPQYLKAEEEYRKAQTPDEQVLCLEKMFLLIPKHKGTEKLQADLKTKIKEAKEESAAEKKAPKKGKTFKFPRQGAGQVVIIGAPNAGKSRIVAELTNAKPEVAPFPFTTREPAPAMMPWEDVNVQLIDTPPITADQFEGYLLGMVRSADAVLLCFDGSSDDAPEQTESVIKQFAERKTLLDVESGFGEENFSIVKVKTLLVVTRGDDPGAGDRLAFYREMVATPLATLNIELDRPDSAKELRDQIYRAVNVIRVYTKPPGKKADMTAPFTIPVGGTVEDLAGRVHRELPEKLKFAKVWGSGVHDGQSVGPDHVLSDRDVVELHT